MPIKFLLPIMLFLLFFAVGCSAANDTTATTDEMLRLLAEGDRDAAFLVGIKAVEEAEKSAVENPMKLLDAASALASLYDSVDKYEEAEPLYRRVLNITQEEFGSDDPRTSSALVYLALIYVKMKKFEEAEPLLKKALLIDEKPNKLSDYRNLSRSLNSLGLLYYAQVKFDLAEPYLERANELYKQNGKPNPETMRDLGKLYREQGKFEEAEKLLKDAVEIFEKDLWPEHYYVAEVLEELAKLYKKMGRPDDEKRSEDRASEIWKIIEENRKK